MASEDADRYAKERHQEKMLMMSSSDGNVENDACNFRL